MISQQKEIENFFNHIYSSKGFDYLRKEQAYQIFTTILKPVPGSRHLDVACGPGVLLKVFSRLGLECYGIDLSEIAIQKCKDLVPDARVQVGNAEELPFENEYFDTLTCIGSIERMIDREKAIREQVRVLKPGAEVCYMVRNSENFTWKYILKPLGWNNKRGHQDALNLQQWSELFEIHGLEIIKVFPDHWPYYRLLIAINPWRKIDTSKIIRFPLSISLAYEFIFHLRKK